MYNSGNGADCFQAKGHGRRRVRGGDASESRTLPSRPAFKSNGKSTVSGFTDDVMSHDASSCVSWRYGRSYFNFDLFVKRTPGLVVWTTSRALLQHQTTDGSHTQCVWSWCSVLTLTDPQPQGQQHVEHDGLEEEQPEAEDGDGHQVHFLICNNNMKINTNTHSVFKLSV